jgi:hypothetical protein
MTDNPIEEFSLRVYAFERADELLKTAAKSHQYGATFDRVMELANFLVTIGPNHEATRELIADALAERDELRARVAVLEAERDELAHDLNASIEAEDVARAALEKRASL